MVERVSATARRAPGRRDLPHRRPARRRRRVRRDLAARPRPSAARQLDEACSPSSPAIRRLSRNGFPQANMFDQPEFEALLRTNLKRYPQARTARRRRGHRRRRRDATAASASRTPTGPTAASTSSKPTTCSAATAPTASRAPGSAPAWRISGSSSAGSSSTSPPPPTSISGRASTRCATRSARAPTCGSATTRYRWEFRLLDGERAADFDTLDALGPLLRRGSTGGPQRRAGAVARHRVHVPRATRRPLASGPDLSARRRRPSDAAVHRSGHGRRAARRDEPGVEARRRARLRPCPRASSTATSRSENRTPAP